MKEQSNANLFDEYKETIIRQVDGSMAIEGMPLTADDKQRIREFAFDPAQVENVVVSLVKKHSVVKKE